MTHAEQDLLRAMLVFAGAGLDSLLKQLIRDSLQALARQDSAVQEELETFVGRRLRGDPLIGQGDAGAGGRQFLAHILVASTPQQRVAEEYIKDLTGESLQSAERLFRATKALGVTPDELKLEAKELKAIFDARNEIIHEMDIRLESKQKKARKRRSRTIDDMTQKAERLLAVGQKVIDAVERKLGAAA